MAAGRRNSSSYGYKTRRMLPKDYICHKCGIAGHWVNRCKARQQSPPADYVCHKCGIAGHWVNKCKVRQQSPPADYICHKCGQSGHFIAFCPNKQQDDPSAAPAQLKPSNQLNLSKLLNYQYNPLLYSKIHIVDTSNSQINIIKTIDLLPYKPQCGAAFTVFSTPKPQLLPPCSVYTNKPKKLYPAWYCTSIQTCKAFSTLISCLQYWHGCENTGSLANIFTYLHRSNKYMHIVSAYHHLLDIHLNASHKRDDYSYINQKVCQAVPCDFTTCKSYIRNQRERVKGENKVAPNNKKEYTFLRDLLDTIHVYLVHGADCGYRYIEGNKYFILDKPARDDKKDESKNASYGNGCLFDYAVQKAKAWQGKTQPYTQASQNKFQTNIDETKKALSGPRINLDILKAKFGKKQIMQQWIHYLKENECDTDNILEQIEDPSSVLYDNFALGRIKVYIAQAQADVKSIANGFGIRLYYWDYYKTSTEQDNWHCPGIPYKDLYVAPPMYSSFKNEILEKHIPIATWDQKIYAADRIRSQSHILKKIKSCLVKENTSTRYNIDKKGCLGVYHILSIVFYTSFNDLYKKFSRAFPYSPYSESLPAIIKRNRKWHYLGKYLREVVEAFGEKIGQNDQRRYCNKGGFYHGISNVLFREHTVCFYRPLSTSKQLAVAVRFTKPTGTILELKQGMIKYTKRLKYFNVSLVSSFAVEDERLFMGGKYRIRVASIHTLQDNMYTKPLMHALFLIHKVLNGGYLQKNNVRFKQSDIRLAKKLLTSPSDLPLYAQEIWRVFKYAQVRVEVDMPCMQHVDVLFFKLLFSRKRKRKNLLLFNKITDIFPNVTKIVCKGVDYKGPSHYAYSPYMVSSDFLSGVMDCLCKVRKNTKLEIIIIKTDKYAIKDDCKLFVAQFSKIGWDIQKENDEINRPWKPLYNQYSTIILKKKTK